MRLLNFTIIKFTFCLIVGILIGEFELISINPAIKLSMILMVLVTIAFLISKFLYKKSIWFGLISYLCLISFGIIVHHLHQHKNFKNHYSRNISSDKEYTITLKIKERLKPNLYNEKYVGQVLSINNFKVRGKVLFNLQRDSLNKYLKVDEIAIFPNKFTSINPSLNPNQFDYGAFLKNQNIYHQVTIEDNTLLKTTLGQRTIFGRAADFRNTIITKLRAHNFEEDELAIINALLLGQRQDLSKTIYQDYVNAGAIHILAVSGLHIGLILLILNILLKPLEWLNQGFIIKAFIILVLLWTYAVVAGLSASIVRAVTMFSVFAIAMHLKRPTNIYNTVAISLFILLIIKPMYLFEVGFQLSYTAVLAIVSIQPWLYKQWQPKWKLIDYFWQIFTVSIAAQLGVAPLSIFYFHQFPSLFFISNLVIIPFLGLILGMGILIMGLALISILPKFLAVFYSSVISLMNLVVGWVSKQESFLFNDISLSFFQMIAFYFLLISLIVCFKRPRYRHYIALLVCILLVQGVYIIQKRYNTNDEFIIFHKSRYSLIGQNYGRHLIVNHNLDSTRFQKDRIIRDYKIGNFIKSMHSNRLKSIYKFHNNYILIIDSLGIYNVKSFKPEFILLRNSPKVNLERMIDSIKPNWIIADGSNYKSYVKRWKTTCRNRNIKFFDTSTEGAVVLVKKSKTQKVLIE